MPNERLAPLTEEEIQFWKNLNFDDILLSKDDSMQYTKRQYMKYQSKAGQAAGLSFLINPDLDDYFCSHHNSMGFRVRKF